MGTAMDLAAFEDGLDRHGADLARWPAADRAAAHALLATSAAARTLHADLGLVEDVLRERAVDSIAPGPMAVRAMGQPQEKPVPPALRRAGWGAVAAAALLLGVLVGGIVTDREDPIDHVMAALDAGQVDVD